MDSAMTRLSNFDRQLLCVSNLKSARPTLLRIGTCFLVSFLILMNVESLTAQVLRASDGSPNDNFGSTVSVAGNIGLIGARDENENGFESGSAYVFRNLDTVLGTVNESVKLVASNGVAEDLFGVSVSVSGNTGLVGSLQNNQNRSGTAYVFRGLDTASGTVVESARLNPSDAQFNDVFGEEVSIFDDIGLVGAFGGFDGGIRPGAAYVFRDLNTVTGSVTESAKLLASDRMNNDSFGNESSLFGTTALIGASATDQQGLSTGSAYVFRDLDTVTGTVTESAKLEASDGTAFDNFGASLSLSGNLGLVGAFGDDEVNSGFTNDVIGSAYVFRDLDTVSGTVNESAKLTASDAAVDARFGLSVSLAGNTGLVGALGTNNFAGAAYVFQGLDTASGDVNESVKITESISLGADNFGDSVSLDGDRFIITAVENQVSGTNGKELAYTGTVSSMTTLDIGNTSASINGISFESREDWIIGQTTSNNQVTLTDGDTAEVLSAGKAVSVGAEAGSNENSLTIGGILEANEVVVGGEGNFGNQLLFESTAGFTIDSITLFADNQLLFEGDLNTSDLLNFELGETDLFYSNGVLTELITEENVNDFLLVDFDSNTGFTKFTAVAAVPEPSTACLLFFGIAGIAMRRVKRRCRLYN